MINTVEVGVATLTTALLSVAIWLPGASVLFAARASRKDLFFLAPIFSAALVGVGAIFTPLLGLPWGWGALALTTAATIPIAVLIGWVTDKKRRKNNETESPQPAEPSIGIRWGMLVSVPFATLIWVNGISSFYHPPQTWDAVFHINALRWILDSKNASSLHFSSLASSLPPTEATSGSIYPAGFHALAYLGWVDDPVFTLNVFAAIVAILLWPLSMGFMARVLAPQTPFIHTATIVLATAYSAFPERSSSYGTLWANTYAYGLVPVIIGLCARWFGRTPDTPMGIRTTLAIIIGSFGIATAHPTGVLVAFIVALVLLIDLLIRLVKRSTQLPLLKIGVLGLLIATIALASWQVSKLAAWASVISFGRLATGKPQDEAFGAVFDAQLSLMPYGDSSPEWILGVLTLFGAAVAAYYAQYRWTLITWVAFCYLFVVSAAIHLPGYVLVAPWYSDPIRLGAMVPLMGAFIAALGLNFLVTFVSNKMLKVNGSETAKKKLVLGNIQIVALCLTIITTGALGYSGGVAALKMHYDYKPTSLVGGLVSPEEIEFIKTLPKYVKPGEMIASDPRTGGALIYGYTGIPVTNRHLDGAWSAEQTEVSRFFAQRQMQRSVCSHLAKMNAKYFYTDSVTYWRSHRIQITFDGYYKAGQNPRGLELIAESGTAKLYRITDCSALK